MTEQCQGWSCFFASVFSYKHAIDGLYQVATKEGPMKLFNGASMACSRAALVTIGQVKYTIKD